MNKFTQSGWYARVLAAVFALTLLAACGGGGGGTAPATGSQTANAAPVPALTLAGTLTPGGSDSDVVAYTGTFVTLDASGSKDPDGDAITFTWTMISRPDGGGFLPLLGTGAQLVFTPNVAGTYVITLRVTDSKGAFAEKQVRIVASASTPANSAPQVVVVANVPPHSEGSTDVRAAVGYTVSLTSNGYYMTSGSPQYDALSEVWTLVSKPANSKAQMTSTYGGFSQVVADVPGVYLVQLVVKDQYNVSSSYQVTIFTEDYPPRASISTNVTPVSQINGPIVPLPVNTTLTLSGTSSTDADGDSLTYTWTLQSKPVGSSATLSAGTGPTVQLTPDVDGSYKVKLRVTDPAGAYSEQVMTIVSGNKPPNAVIDKSSITVLAGSVAGASAGYSFDDDGDGLTFAWAIVAHPAGSNAKIPSPGAVRLAFVPDLAGTYVASVTVSDGRSSSLAYVTIRALSSVTNQVALPFTPLDARYSKGIDRFVTVAANPDALHIVDPFTGSIHSVSLPLPVKAFNLSPDGKLAAVLEEGVLSLVDLTSATLLHSSSTGGSQTEAFVTNAAIVYLVGQTGAQTVSPAVSVLDGHTGTDLTASLGQSAASSAYFYGTQRGVFAATKNKAFLMSSDASSTNIAYFTLDPATGAVKQTGNSPYHGDYAMSAPLFLSSDENLLFTSSGTFFRTDTLFYVGKLSMTGFVQSMSHSLSANEAIVMGASNNYSGPAPYRVYEASYHRFTGPLFLPDADIALPTIGGQQSYGVSIFHSANDNHVTLVQTGSATANAAGLTYYLLTR